MYYILFVWSFINIESIYLLSTSLHFRYVPSIPSSLATCVIIYILASGQRKPKSAYMAMLYNKSLCRIGAFRMESTWYMSYVHFYNCNDCCLITRTLFLHHTCYNCIYLCSDICSIQYHILEGRCIAQLSFTLSKMENFMFVQYCEKSIKQTNKQRNGRTWT